MTFKVGNQQKNTRFSIRRDLGLQLLALYLLFVVPVLAGALVFDSFVKERLEQDVKAADLALARAIALETDASPKDVPASPGTQRPDSWHIEWRRAANAGRGEGHHG